MKYISLLIVSFFIYTSAVAQATFTVSQDESSITVKGTPHSWESNANEFEGEGSFILTEGAFEGIESLTITVQADEIDGGKRKMNSLTREALEVKDHPLITFSLNSLNEVTEDSVTVSGTLTMAGETRDIQLKAAYTINADGSLTVSGTQPIDMETYDVEPPRFMFMKVGKDVDVDYNVKFVQN